METLTLPVGGSSKFIKLYLVVSRSGRKSGGFVPTVNNDHCNCSEKFDVVEEECVARPSKRFGVV